MLPAFGTIVAKRVLPYARVLGRSLAEHIRATDGPDSFFHWLAGDLEPARVV